MGRGGSFFGTWIWWMLLNGFVLWKILSDYQQILYFDRFDLGWFFILMLSPILLIFGSAGWMVEFQMQVGNLYAWTFWTFHDICCSSQFKYSLFLTLKIPTIKKPLDTIQSSDSMMMSSHPQSLIFSFRKKVKKNRSLLTAYCRLLVLHLREKSAGTAFNPRGKQKHCFR